MTNVHARQGEDRKRNDSNFKRQGKHGKGGQSNGNGHGRRGRKYAKFSMADQRQAELAAKGGSLLADMPIRREQREQEQEARRRGRFR